MVGGAGAAGAALALAVCAWGAAPPTTGTALPRPARTLDLRVGARGRYVGCFQRPATVLGRAAPRAGPRGDQYVLLDTRTGDANAVASLLPMGAAAGLAALSGEIEFSPSGRFVVVHAVGDPTSPEGASVAFLVDLRGPTAAKLAGGMMVQGRWVGHSVAVSVLRGGEGFAPIKLVPAAGGLTRELPVRGLALAGDEQGTAMLLLADPKAPAAAVSPAELRRRGRLLLADGDGKVARELGAPDELPQRHAVSPAGKWFALQAGGAKGRTWLVSPAGGTLTAVAAAGRLIGVDDAGRAVTLGWPGTASAPTGPAWVRAWTADGKSADLLGAEANVLDACVSGGRVYYAVAAAGGGVDLRWRALAGQ